MYNMYASHFYERHRWNIFAYCYIAFVSLFFLSFLLSLSYVYMNYFYNRHECEDEWNAHTYTWAMEKSGKYLHTCKNGLTIEMCLAHFHPLTLPLFLRQEMWLWDGILRVNTDGRGRMKQNRIQMCVRMSVCWSDLLVKRDCIQI